MSVWSFLTEPSKPWRSVYRYGALIFILYLLADGVRLLLRLSPGHAGAGYTSLVLCLMLLFFHLAYQFNWRMGVLVALRILAWGWLCFVSFYMIFRN
jgi:hypothetical protein